MSEKAFDVVVLSLVGLMVLVLLVLVGGMAWAVINSTNGCS